jgi:DNA polymerase-3 subunit gamma/tau
MTDANSQAYYRTWRSKTFGDLVGQEPVSRTLKNAVKMNRIAHAYLFCGPRGVGKTSAARILAKAINCPNVLDGEPCGTCAVCRSIQDGREIDILELDAASNRGIDQIRDIREKVGLAPASLRTKFYILDEAHMITPDAFNALLKTLEEPPPQTIFVLVTTDPHKVPATIVSRCQQLDFRRIKVGDSVQQLGRVCDGEGIKPEPGVLEMIARASGGSLRDAEGALDQVVAYGGTRPKVADARLILGSAGPESARNLLDLLITDRTEDAIRLVNRLVDEGADPRQIAMDVVDVLRDVMLLRASDRLSDLVDAEPEALDGLRNIARKLAPNQIVELIRVFTPAPATRGDVRPQLPLEMSVVEAIQALRRQSAASEVVAPVFQPVEARPTVENRSVREAVSPAPPRPSLPPVQPTPPPVTSSISPPAMPVASTDIGSAAGRSASADRLTPVSGDDGILFQTVLSRWNDILEACGSKNRSVQALVRVARPLGAEDGAIVLGFPYEFHRDRIDNIKNRSIVEDIIGQVVGLTVRVRCTLANKDTTATTDPLQVAMDDPIVRHAISLGARIRGVSDSKPEERQ